MKKAYIPALILGIILISGLLKCPMYAVVGVPCPSCGMTRAWQSLFSGDIPGAFRMHPLFWIPALFLFGPFRKNRVIIASLMILAAVWIIRMWLFFPQEAPMNFNYESILGELL